MIRLCQAPTDAAARILDEAKQRYAALIAAGEEVPAGLLGVYRHRDVKAAIKAETCEKCLYCESKITHVSFGDVEHIVPKAPRPDLMFEYSNLSLACSVCNNSKRDYYDETAPLLNPYVDDPLEHLIAAGPMVVQFKGSRVGQVTELTIRLNRSELIDRRRDRLRAITALADQYHREPDNLLRNAIARELWREADRCAEFSMAVSAYLTGVCAVPKPQAASSGT